MCLVVTIFAFCMDKMSMGTKKCTYLTFHKVNKIQVNTSYLHFSKIKNLINFLVSRGHGLLGTLSLPVHRIENNNTGIIKWLPSTVTLGKKVRSTSLSLSMFEVHWEWVSGGSLSRLQLVLPWPPLSVSLISIFCTSKLYYFLSGNILNMHFAQCFTHNHLLRCSFLKQ